MAGQRPFTASDSSKSTNIDESKASETPFAVLSSKDGEPSISSLPPNTTLIESNDDVKKTVLDLPSSKVPTRQSPASPVSPDIVRGWPGNCM